MINLPPKYDNYTKDISKKFNKKQMYLNLLVKVKTEWSAEVLIKNNNKLLEKVKLTEIKGSSILCEITLITNSVLFKEKVRLSGFVSKSNIFFKGGEKSLDKI